MTFDDDQPQTLNDPFWRRQFRTQTTEAQAIVDVAFGVLAPLLCFYLDPIIFRGGLAGPPPLQPYQLFAYAVAGIQICLFVVAITFGTRLGTWARLVGGALISGAIFSAVIGVLILPYTILGLMVVIGALGFIPFITAFVYLRVGWRTFKREEELLGSSWVPALLVGAILTLGIPALVSVYISKTTARSIETILHGDPQQATAALHHLQWMPFIPSESLSPLVQAYMTETDQKKREQLRTTYRAIAGEDIEGRIAIIND